MIQLTKAMPLFIFAALILTACPEPVGEQIIVRKVASAPGATKSKGLEMSDANKRLMLDAKLKKIRAKLVSNDERKCKVDADCSLINFDCCSCNEGGRKQAVAKDKKLSVGVRRTEVCAKVMCAQSMSSHASCNATEAACVEGYCQLKLTAQTDKIETEKIP